MEQECKQIINQLPERETSIRQLWDSDQDFRELCQDYVLCLETLDRWPDGAPPQTPLSKYLSLRRRLELEIELKINNVQPQRN